MKIDLYSLSFTQSFVVFFTCISAMIAAAIITCGGCWLLYLCYNKFKDKLTRHNEFQRAEMVSVLLLLERFGESIINNSPNALNLEEKITVLEKACEYISQKENIKHDSLFTYKQKHDTIIKNKEDF